MGQVIQLAAVAPPAHARVSVVAVENRQPVIRTDTVYVVFTSTDETLAAIRTASELARAMGVPLTLLHFRTVPYPAPVDVPTGVSPIETDDFKTQLQREGIDDATVRVVLCRDAYKAAALAFKAHSLIVVGGRRHRWGSSSARLRRTLETKGHAVVFVDGAAQEEHSHA